MFETVKQFFSKNFMFEFFFFVVFFLKIVYRCAYVSSIIVPTVTMYFQIEIDGKIEIAFEGCACFRPKMAGSFYAITLSLGHQFVDNLCNMTFFRKIEKNFDHFSFFLSPFSCLSWLCYKKFRTFANIFWFHFCILLQLFSGLV